MNQMLPWIHLSGITILLLMCHVLLCFFFSSSLNYIFFDFVFDGFGQKTMGRLKKKPLVISIYT